ncbi:LacI family transcriptional regulator [Paenibacillus sp. sptzw28]|uniref:LacI family DNA-binding transcriptional regulator n=1 Tax=Paenibacillus sp. sptzw28 TaxID=715179 RepID=UPI001C6E22D7|nr:LacI family DNA-binding transcriptional regulator [Paenibacillus sp. sptzw28]QYR19075.1 LacI family transcriptional regulator [Paenibacillus sp. sptzw28]
MAYTIKEIAEMAGVSKSTVSRVITGQGYASEESRGKVMNVIEALQYKPNAVARAMVSKRTHNIGVIIYRDQQPVASHPLYGKILDAILSAAEPLGYSVFVMTDQEMSLRSADFMLEKRVDGLILISRLRNNVIEYIKSFGVPYLMINGTTEDEEVIRIVNQDDKGGELAAEHLHHVGHRRICIIAGPQAHRSHFLRLQGFLGFAERSGFPVPPDSVYQSPASTFEAGYETISRHWSGFCRRRYTALFATNDMIALGAMKFLMEQGVRVPSQIAVMGYDDVDLAAMYHPSLTTVGVDKVKMGREAVLLLDRLINSEQSPLNEVECEPRLIIRETT